MLVKPIETRYAGCHFRSRLEARWAVFFDRLGVAWEYEEQGYEVGRTDGRTVRYLPDFYLPDLGTHVEVKGRLDEKDLDKLVTALVPWGPGLPGDGDPPILMLGPLPKLKGQLGGDYPNVWHRGLHFHEGDVYARSYAWTDCGVLSLTDPRGLKSLGNDNGDTFFDDDISDDLIGSVIDYGSRCSRIVCEAYLAASSARFEFGGR